MPSRRLIPKKMKRACPYDENLLRMSKVHLMDHHVDKSAMQKIYDDTLMKLKNGAKKVLTEQDCNILGNLPGKREGCQKMKQTGLSSFLKNPIPIATPDVDKIVKVYELGTVCSYCDKNAEIKPCKNCGEGFCSSCCFITYNKNNEEFICLSCNN